MILAGRYQLDRRIGQGGMAEVWVATDVQLDRRVALKWLRPALASDPVVAERFRREAIAVARLNHPNIVAVHDVFEHAGRQAVVMQLVDGKSLRQLLDSQKRLGPELTIHIGAAIAGALDEAHRAGFVHRDVKPGNILVTSDGRVLLTDFGIAKGLDPEGDDLTSDNVMMGTAKYLSPEQVRGRKLDGRADIYSLGLVLYECLAGRVPFLGESDADTALARLQRDPTDLIRLRPTLPPGLVDLIHRTLARNPAHRPASGHELRNALLNVDTTAPHIDGTPAEPPRRTPFIRGATPTGPSRPQIPGEPTARSSASTEVAHGLPRRTTRTDPSAQRDDESRSARPPTRTPPAGTIRGRPARGLQQHWMPSLIMVLVLLAVAMVVVITLWLALSIRGDTSAPSGDAGAATPGADADPGDDGAADAGEADVGSPAPSDGPVGIATVEAWDPDGDASENSEQAPLALAGSNPDSGWPTLCYSSQYLGGKRGVGLIVSLTDASGGTVGVDVLNAPYQLEIFSTDTVTPPADPDRWGSSLVGTEYAERPGRIETSVPDGTRHVLLWLKELGPDDVCSSARPYRGRLGNLTFSP
jgi:eukaryotic-like serine/threonine-protein kinase